MSASAEIVEPGRYDYELTVEFPSVYILEHTPPEFRNEYAQPTTRRRYVSGQFDLTEHIVRSLIRDHFVRKACEDLIGDLVTVTVTRFELTPVAA